jgi:dTDP-4-amino-4,6-dideoxygalactose transaminase
MDREQAPRIIGGMFALPDLLRVRDSSPPFLTGRDLLLVNGQSGLSVLIDLLSPANVWLPSYLCVSALLEPVKRSQAAPRFYEVNYDLAIGSLQWLDRVRRGDLVVLIDYFGFPCDEVCVHRTKAQGAWVLEDACQALLSQRADTHADFVLFSPRKFVGVPDGGILSLNREIDLDGLRLESPPADWWLKSLSASLLRREFDVHGGEHPWFELFQETEAEAPLGGYAMSELTKTLLMRCFDYDDIAQRRRRNYGVLLEALGHLAIFRDLPAGVVPLGFPMRVGDRDRLRQGLFEQRVYPPVHWPLEGAVPPQFGASHRLAADIMMLPCDQRCDVADMKRMAQLVSDGLQS